MLSSKKQQLQYSAAIKDNRAISNSMEMDTPLKMASHGYKYMFPHVFNNMHHFMKRCVSVFS